MNIIQRISAVESSRSTFSYAWYKDSFRSKSFFIACFLSKSFCNSCWSFSWSSNRA